MTQYNNNNNDFELAKRLVLECLSPKRVNHDLSSCLSNINRNLEQTFIEFSRKGSATINWNNPQGTLGMSTLHKWAIEDNKTKYEEIMHEHLKDFKDIKRYIYEKYKHQFKCFSITQNKWYHYMNHRWILNDRGYALKRLIAHDFSEYADKELLSSQGFFRECAELFYDEQFVLMLDSNYNLLHFMNGVYDLDKNEFREGYPEDHISLSTNINFIEQPDMEDQLKIQNIDDLLHKIMPHSAVKNYMMSLISNCLHGTIKDCKYHSLFGDGVNGKAILMNLFKNAIGDYGMTIPISTLIKDKELEIELRGKRVIFSEKEIPEVHSKNLVDYIKQIMGDDKIKFHLFYSSDKLPTIQTDEEDVWRSIRFVEFLTPLLYNKDEMKDWYEVFIYMLIKNFQNKNVITPPFEVILHTFAYRTEVNYYKQFVQEFLQENIVGKVGIEHIFPEFMKYISNAGVDSSKYNRQRFVNHMNHMIGHIDHRNNWNGWSLVNSCPVPASNPPPPPSIPNIPMNHMLGHIDYKNNWNNWDLVNSCPVSESNPSNPPPPPPQSSKRIFNSTFGCR